MSEIKIPDNYEPKLDLLQTEMAIKLIKDTFERRLGESLRLTRVSAPLFVNARTGLNDNLNGIERPVQFDIPIFRKTTSRSYILCQMETLRTPSLSLWRAGRSLHRYECDPT